MYRRAVTTRLSLGTKVGYGVGDFAANLVFQSIMLYLMYFLTDVFLVGASMAGTIILVSKLWDAVSDPMMGYISDRTRSRWGRKRPYLLFGALPLGVGLVLLFGSPPVPEEWRAAYSAVAFLFVCTAYTVVNVPYGALTADMTHDSGERSRLTGFRMFFAILGTLMVAGATRPLVSLFSDEASGFRGTMAIFAVVVVVLTWVTFAVVREQGSDGDSDDRVRLADVVAVVSTNKPFILLTLGMVLHMTALGVLAAMVNFFFKYNMAREDFVPVAFLAMFATAAVVLPLWVLLSGKLGKKWAFSLGMGLLTLVLVALFFVRDFDPWVLLPLFVAGGVGLSTLYLCPWSMVPDTVEFSQWKTGLRREGMLYGIFLFSQKGAAALAGFVVGQGLDLSGYLPNVVQTPGALLGIHVLMTLVPAALIVGGVVLISFYPLSEELHQRIVGELHS